MAAPVLLDQDAIIGFGFGKDEIFLRGLFLERARLFQALSIACPAGLVCHDGISHAIATASRC
jgi:hypothetical protein